MQKTSYKKLCKIAVVGMSGLFPKALTLDRFIDNIKDKKESIIPVPQSRWIDPVDHFISPQNMPDKAISRRAGVIEGFKFNSNGYLVESDLLAQLDPLHHLVLQAGKDAFLQCVHTKEDKFRTGVILAAIALPTESSSKFSWDTIIHKTDLYPATSDILKTSAVSLPATLLSRAMGFHGTSFTLDAACASSLYAIKLACEHLHLNKADIMVTGGVSRPDSLYTQIGFTQLQALSPTGTCSPFDKDANGLVVGEGTGIIVLKRLDDAIKDKDHIHAIISGAGVSNDIEGTLVGPASEGQVRSMIQAYNQASWSPHDIQYMECHGSGTPVGDQVELSSIHTLLNHYQCLNKKLSIGSVKSMVGHLLTAAGAAGFIKTILAMKQKILPPSLNFNEPAEHSVMNHSNITVQTQVEDWKPQTSGTTRKAGISAFGFGGINAHILVEEYKPESKIHAVGSTHTKDSMVQVPCAIIGMGTILQKCNSLSDFEKLIFGKKQLSACLPDTRWRRNHAALVQLPGYYMDHLSSDYGEFHIPPNQINDILPQHIVLLKAVKSALSDAGIAFRPKTEAFKRFNIGCAIGIEFDYGATDFHLRWKLNQLSDDLKDKISPPLTFNRTLGALGGIVASRVAREFKLGGPCFTLSANAASGIKAIDTAIHSLSAYETDTFICGAVDLGGDIRQLLLNSAARSVLKPGSKTDFNAASRLILPSEGAAAIVLKRLDKAIQDKDDIYGVITGTSGISGDTILSEDSENSLQFKELYQKSIKAALSNSNCHLHEIGMFETGLTGMESRDFSLLNRIDELEKRDSTTTKLNLSSTAAIIGDTFSASGLFSVITSALCLSRRLIPSAPDTFSKFNQFNTMAFNISGDAVFWDETNDKRKICSSTVSNDGTIGHVIIEAVEKGSNLKYGRNIKTRENSVNQQMVIPSNDPDSMIQISTNPLFISDSTIEKIQKSIISDETQSRDNDSAIQDSNEILHSCSEIELKTDTVASQKMDIKSTDTDIPVNDPAQFDPTEFTQAIFDPERISKGTEATARAHEKFLDFSRENMMQFEDKFSLLTQLSKMISERPEGVLPEHSESPPDAMEDPASTSNAIVESFENPPFLDRDQCLEYAVGKAGNVLGKEFDIIDTYPVRVRLPAEPLMLVDRIMKIEGEMLSLSTGKIVTQHDVKENAWYLDGGKTPVSISIEAGQADLFLSAWLGIDHVIQGKRKYRLLDAKVTFHRTLPEPGETIEYHIEIDRFLKQGDVYLFFFHYNGYINDQLLISMRDGCAGFFTEEEVKNSGGIILKKEDMECKPSRFKLSYLIPVKKEDFPDQKVDALRRGDLEDAFGDQFKNISLGKNLKLPGGRMNLIDRVLEFDPEGGRFGLGSITAEADIHPDDWFLTCHFVDDMVMPGTLMYDCCAHALRIFTQRIGWISTRDDVFYDIVTNNESDLKCRGPVTCETKKARYEIEIKDIGYDPEPYIIADANMFSDDLRIVLYKDMGMKIVGLTKNELESFWRKQ